MTDDEEELRNITGAVITVAFSIQIEQIIDSIESIEEYVKNSLSTHGFSLTLEQEKEILFKSIMRGIEMRKERGKLNES